MFQTPDNFAGIPPKPIDLAMGSAATRDALALQREIMSRRMEALRLYEPSPLQQPFHSCQSMDRLIIGGNRSGKSTAAFVEDSRACLRMDPYKKYPDEGVLMIVGYGWEHCGKVVFPMLFQPGAFKIIKDKITGEWRAFHPQDPEDQARIDETRPAPPLIPRRFLQGGKFKTAIAWVNKKLRQFSRVDLTTGWTIFYFASEGDPEQAQGFQVSLVHFDENIHDRRWLGESYARMADRKARFVWSTLPGDDRTGALDELIDDAQKESEKLQPRISAFNFPFLDNPYIGREEKNLMMARWSVMGEDEVRRRAYGQTSQTWLMYPTYNINIHGFDRANLDQGVVPHHWTRFMVVDPGHVVCATLFAAVPPPSEHKMVLIYDELYVEQCNAPEWGRQLAAKVGDQRFHTFIIDDHGGGLSDLTTGSTWKQVLASELRKRNIRADRTGFNFVPGSDDLEARANAVRMALDPDTGPRLRILRGSCPHLERTLPRFHKKRDPRTKLVTDKPETRGDVHMAQCLEYLIAFDPQFHRQPERRREPSAAVKSFRAEQKRERRRRGAVSLS